MTGLWMLAMALAAGPQAGPPVALDVVALDAASHGQSRYVEALLADAGRQGRLEATPLGMEPRAFVHCRNGNMEGAETCIRYQLSRHPPETAAPPVVVLVGPGLDTMVLVRCLGAGRDQTARQVVTVDRASLRSAGTAPFDADVAILADCIAAARDETVG